MRAGNWVRLLSWMTAHAFAAVIPLLAQTAGTGTRVGTVTDTSGAILVGSKGIVVDTATSFTSEVVTNDEGAYSIPYLAPATYRVTVESGGFKRYVREGVLVRTGEIPRANLGRSVFEGPGCCGRSFPLPNGGHSRILAARAARSPTSAPRIRTCRSADASSFKRVLDS